MITLDGLRFVFPVECLLWKPNTMSAISQKCRFAQCGKTRNCLTPKLFREINYLEKTFHRFFTKFLSKMYEGRFPNYIISTLCFVRKVCTTYVRSITNSTYWYSIRTLYHQIRESAIFYPIWSPNPSYHTKFRNYPTMSESKTFPLSTFFDSWPKKKWKIPIFCKSFCTGLFLFGSLYTML